MYEPMVRPVVLLALLASAAMPLAAHQGAHEFKPVATRLTGNNAATLRVGGMDAQGGTGDWFMSNGTICAIVSDPSQEGDITYQGGVLTDLGFCGREDDHFVALYPAINMDMQHVMIFDSVETALVDDAVQLRTIGRQDGLRVVVTYSMQPARPNVLSIDTEIRRMVEGNALQQYGEILLTAHSMPLYDVSINRLTASTGFALDEDATGLADLTVLIGSGDPGHNIVYGYHQMGADLVRVGQKPLALPVYEKTKADYVTHLTLLDKDLGLGDSLSFRQEIILAEGDAVSPVTDQLWPNGFVISGGTGEEGVVLLVEDAKGAAVTHAITDEDGGFAFRVPVAGDYLVRVRAAGREEVIKKFTIEDEKLTLPTFRLAAPATLLLPRHEVMRLTFKGMDGATDPNFIDAHIDQQYKRGDHITRELTSRQVFLSGDATDPRSVILAPGSYQVVASRGPEYSVQLTAITVASGEEAVLGINAPTRVLTSKGYLAVDFHVHSGHSFDNNLSDVPRIKSFVAQGAEVLVATEHDTLYDFTDLIHDMGLGSLLKTVTGTELTTELGSPAAPYGIGHANVFPLEVQPLAPRRGAPKNENLRWRDIIAKLHKRAEPPIVQINHPLDGNLGELSIGKYFSHMSMPGKAFDPRQPLTSEPNNVMVDPDPVTGVRDIDFDVIEVENGNRWGKRYVATRDDWFALLRQGVHMVAAANSDSHGVEDTELVANVRNMVFTGADDLANYSEKAFLQAIRDGNLYGTNGPLLTVTVNGTVMGGLAGGEKPILSLRVDAADWMTVDHYLVYINGELTSEGPLRVAETLAIPLTIAPTIDAFVTVEVTGPITDLSSEVIGQVPPFAFSNPIYVDGNGDGKFTPIGTPLPTPVVTLKSR